MEQHHDIYGTHNNCVIFTLIYKDIESTKLGSLSSTSACTNWKTVLANLTSANPQQANAIGHQLIKRWGAHPLGPFVIVENFSTVCCTFLYPLNVQILFMLPHYLPSLLQFSVFSIVYSTRLASLFHLLHYNTTPLLTPPPLFLHLHIPILLNSGYLISPN